MWVQTHKEGEEYAKNKCVKKGGGRRAKTEYICMMHRRQLEKQTRAHRDQDTVRPGQFSGMNHRW